MPRKVAPEDKMTEQLPVLMSPALLAAIRSASTTDGVSMGEFVRRAIRRHLTDEPKAEND